jgi:signal recognition particle subunit SRP54
MAIFDSLSDKLLGSLKKLRGQSRITEENIQDVIKEIRMSLLEADVNFKVVKTFIDHVKEKALGQNVLGGVNPGQQFVKRLRLRNLPNIFVKSIRKNPA